jgi:hypothetical protein
MSGQAAAGLIRRFKDASEALSSCGMEEVRLIARVSAVTVGVDGPYAGHRALAA